MGRFWRYVFYRLNAHQKRRIRDSKEAAMAAAVYMSIPLVALIALLDTLVSQLLSVTSLFDAFGTWPAAIFFFLIVYAVHYFKLVRRRATRDIELEFSEAQDLRYGNVAVVAYLVGPLLLLFFLSIVFGQA